jgi:hypothetical protein
MYDKKDLKVLIWREPNIADLDWSRIFKNSLATIHFNKVKAQEVKTEEN